MTLMTFQNQSKRSNEDITQNRKDSEKQTDRNGLFWNKGVSMPERGYYNWTPLGSGLITETSSLGAAGGESQSSVTLSSPPICSLLLYWPSNINQLINKQKVGNYRWNSKIKSGLILSHVFLVLPASARVILSPLCRSFMCCISPLC